MSSPFPESSSRAGKGHIVVQLLPNNASVLEATSYQYPLKLISPSVAAAEPKSVLVFLLSYGGGLVGGDRVHVSIQIKPRARLSIVTQGHTKIFKATSPDVATRQELRVHAADGAALCLLPDPVQPFRDSVYEQHQVFTLAGGASLCLLDWVTQGRAARGEDWSFARWVGRNEVWARGDPATAQDRLLVRDNIVLDGAAEEVHAKTLRDTMHGHAVFGTLILRGSLTKSLGQFFLSEFAALPRLGARDFRSAEARERDEAAAQTPLARWRLSRQKEEQAGGILWSAAHVRGCVVVKFGAATVEAGRRWIGSMLIQEKSIESHFGEQALLCVR